LRYPELADCTNEGSGALLLPLASGSDDAILWFRPELSRTIAWGGNPAEHATADLVTGRISPRASFAAWKETVSGRSAPWSDADLALVRELRRAIEVEAAKRTKAALQESEARYWLLAEHSGVVVALNAIDGTRLYVSPAAERVLGWRAEDMIGHRAIEFVHPDDQQAFRDAHALLTTGAGESSACYRYRRPDGSWLWVDGHARLRACADGEVPKEYVVVLRDATERKAVEFKLMEALELTERMAATDGLTGLANRRHLDIVAEREWRRCARERLPLSMALLDADRFKRFNDCYGHIAGDECLRAIASQLDAVARRPADLAARYGGEEFLLLMPNTGPDGASQVARELCRLVHGLGIVHEENAPGGVMTVSIGVATAWPGDPAGEFGSVDALLSAADAALYRAKSSGRNQVVGRPCAPPSA
jgi:diguanylate cyclase (GGDEF)-like protein/PAS domain S-box-containing protein